MIKELVVILIITHKAELNEYELISLQQCYKILGDYPIKIIVPDNLDVSFYKENLTRPEFDMINPIWQSTYSMFNRLKIEPFLYKRYQNFKYILFYEPDAIVFKDELKYWCSKGYDYIGAPWFDGYDNANEDSKFIAVGNGGLSLRNVKSHLRLLNDIKKIETIYNLPSYSFIGWVRNLELLIKAINKYNEKELADFVKNFKGNEDGFWCLYASKYVNNLSEKKGFLKTIFLKFFNHSYKIAPYEDAIRFSMETKSRILYQENNQELPFGSHAWFKYDIEFWKPFIKLYGYELP